MEIILLQDTYYAGNFYKAGVTVEIEKSVAERLIKANLAHGVAVAETATEPEKAVAENATTATVKKRGRRAKK